MLSSNEFMNKEVCPINYNFPNAGDIYRAAENCSFPEQFRSSFTQIKDADQSFHCLPCKRKDLCACEYYSLLRDKKLSRKRRQTNNGIINEKSKMTNRRTIRNANLFYIRSPRGSGNARKPSNNLGKSMNVDIDRIRHAHKHTSDTGRRHRNIAAFFFRL